MKEKAAELAVVSNKTFAASTAVNLHHYDISSALQTTLEFDELIAIFCNKIQHTIPHNGVEYTNPEFDLEYKRGVLARHSCSYALKVEEQQLGELKLTRSQRFSKDELKLLESLLCCLIYPLRNATLFQQALKMAFTDPLTKANNRTAFNDSLLREIKRAHRSGSHLSLIFVDVDHFKSINDQYGHECGDLALASVAAWLKESVRGSDAVYRYGGEEFVILLSDTDIDGAMVIGERIRADIESHTLAYGMDVLNLTASLGVATLKGDDTFDSLLKRADAAMYQAKRQGRNRVEAGF
ncbi:MULTISPECIES: GGDEF domain-containing protein [Methylomonas]|uniref:diguanylate cyclase n=1 Tax=Methylomonas koyamae TaxID=702114 RepID=A0A177PFA0_9GAMM|nr:MULTISPECIES: GGDEF domain-containing protein [Methylomonas]ANE56074.1 diguanylate cyclase [Methylomonas sp. DH-1]ATG90954.1 diguanylate cyclase [Methylomonas koyamae]OAI12427.1 diguanylate cyclase [Methylomonas koyamae]OAI28936.1 diguanylate cyclase [Methylomonas koyamae]WNB77504.1 GGDEF domain-containing protein [Methylomonas koyamae]